MSDKHKVKRVLKELQNKVEIKKSQAGDGK